MSELAGLLELTNQYTSIMLALLWVSAYVGFRMLKSDIEENGDEIETLHAEHQNVRQDLQRVDQKQNHVVERQEMVLEQTGANEQDIQRLREETARLDGQNDRCSPGDD